MTGVRGIAPLFLLVPGYMVCAQMNYGQDEMPTQVIIEHSQGMDFRGLFDEQNPVTEQNRRVESVAIAR